MKRLLLLTGLLLLLLPAGCREKDTDKLTYEPSVYSQVVADDTLRETLGSVVNNYLSALETHDYSLLMTCADERLPQCNNETAFFDYTIGLQSAQLDTIDWDTLIMDGKDYLLRVSYTLHFTDTFTDWDGTPREPCTEQHIELLRLSAVEGVYYITEIQETGEG